LIDLKREPTIITTKEFIIFYLHQEISIWHEFKPRERR